MADGYRFNLWECIRQGDLSGVGENLFAGTALGIALAAIPFLVTGRYIKGKIRQAVTDEIDICE